MQYHNFDYEAQALVDLLASGRVGVIGLDFAGARGEPIFCSTGLLTKVIHMLLLKLRAVHVFVAAKIKQVIGFES